ncbi:MAG: signal peptidase I [Nitrospinota bacterium]|nr:signal peptidase I [Nitrospinota bacterium]MDH5679227.1 signal peptidase I [Nitrospinota bacterium]MDH5757764.1 signal peptidase I [Nitrospinota bacterium]
MSNADVKASPKEAAMEEDAHETSGVLEFLKAVAIALALALFIRTFMFQPFKIPSESMVPTLLVGDHLLVNKMVYLLNDPERGDIVVFRPPHEPDKDFVKRIIGLPGETILLRNNVVHVDGKAIDEPWAIYESHHGYPGMGDFGPVRVPEGKLFMMGDNRHNSQDSRVWGFLDKSAIHGKAFIIHWSWTGHGVGVRFNRVGKLL